MFDPSKALKPATLQRYMESELTSATNNYFSENGVIPGRWHGDLIPVLELHGQPVSDLSFNRLTKGQHPITGEQLIQWRTQPAQEKVPAWMEDTKAWTEEIGERYIAAMNEGRDKWGKDSLGITPGPARERTPHKPIEYTETQRTLIEMHEKASAVFQANLQGPRGMFARKYLEERGITEDLIKEFGIGLAPDWFQLKKELSGYDRAMLEGSGLFIKKGERLEDRFLDRLMIPIQDADGNTIAFAGRDLSGKADAKYVNSPETSIYKKSDVLFNAHRAEALARQTGEAVFTEGYFDVIAAHGAGVAAVASCGTATTAEQVRAAVNLADRHVLNMDPDVAGEKATDKAVQMFMAEGVLPRVLKLAGPPEEKMDPAKYIEMYAKAVNIEAGRMMYRTAVDSFALPTVEWVSQREASAIKGVIAFFESAPSSLRPEILRQLREYLGEGPAPEAKEEKKTPMEHRAGWDFTCNAPKEVSVLAVVAGDERVREANQFAVKKALDVFQRYTQAKMGGNRAFENTGNWIAALFDHDTARPDEDQKYPAPHLHAHVIVFNMTQDQEGKIRAMETGELFKAQTLATAVYQNELGRRLRRLGYELSHHRNGAPKIKGFTAEYIEDESLRGQEIRRKVEERGLTGREAQSIVQHQEREAKLDLSLEQRKGLHRRHAEDRGNQPDQVYAAALAKGQRRRKVNPEKIAQLASEAVDYARETLSERKSVFDHFEVLREACRDSRGRVKVETLEAEIKRQWDEGKFTEVHHHRRTAPGHRFTTPEAIAAEREMIERALGESRKVAPIPITKELIREGYGEKIEDGKKVKDGLNNDQMWMVWNSLTSTEQIQVVQGFAGTGKTWPLRAVREVAEARGFRVHGLGPTSKAREGVVAAGITSETVARYLKRQKRWEVERAADPRPVMFVVDEGSLIATRAMRDFFRTIQPNDRVLLIGDKQQHQSVEAGAAFEQLQASGAHTITLKKIIRQKQEEVLKAVKLLAVRQVKPALEILDAAGMIHEVAKRKDRLESVAERYATGPEGRLVIAPDNRTRRNLNEIIREKLKSGGLVLDDAAEVKVLVTRQDVTGADRRRAMNYRVGDWIRYSNGSTKFGIDAKDYGVIEAVDTNTNMVTVQLGTKSVTYNPEALFGVTLYEPDARKFAVGERIQFTAPWTEKRIATRDTATITEIDDAGNMRARLDKDGRIVSWNARSNRHLDYAYAMTSYSSQGATIKREVLIVIDTADSKSRSLVNSTLGYVAVSRTEQEVGIFTDSKEGLVKTLSRNKSNTTALAPEETAAYKDRKLDVARAMAAANQTPQLTRQNRGMEI